MHKHSAIQNEHGVFILHRDDKALICPKKVFCITVPAQTPMGQMSVQAQIQQMPCDTSCPFAEVTTRPKEVRGEDGILRDDKDQKEDIYRIRCEGGSKLFVLEKVEEFKKPSIMQVSQ